MNDRVGLLAAICVNTDDDMPRLAFADYIEENGEPERAEFIRVQCERAQIRFPNAVNECDGCGVFVGYPHESGCPRAELQRRLEELWRLDAVRYFGQGADFWNEIGFAPALCDTERGFLDFLDAPAVPFLNHDQRQLWHPVHRASPCPVTAQPVRRLRLARVGQMGMRTENGQVTLEWEGGSKSAPITVPMSGFTIIDVMRQFWPWITNLEWVLPNRIVS